MENLADVPLFPLNTVLFPGGVLPLRIFEPRYLDMVRYCMRDACEFGVLLIREGREAGSDVTMYSVGTLARIVDFDQLPDNLLGITTRGTRRFRALNVEQRVDGLYVSRIELSPPEPRVPLPDDCTRYAELLQQALPQMGEYFRHLEVQYDEAAWVSGRLAEVLPIPLAEKQRLLEMDDPLARLKTLQPMIHGSAGN